MDLSFKPRFLRKFNRLPRPLREEAREKIELFRDTKNHQLLKVHKLQGRMSDCCSFSVNYRYRIIFKWEKQNESAVLLTIGDHSVYN